MKVLLLAFLCLASEAYGVQRYMQTCELIRTMKRLGMDGYNGVSLGMWACLAKYSSRLDTGFHIVEAGRAYYGIFQINAMQWCDNGIIPSENRCGISCSKFLDYDLRDDVECLKKIVVTNGALRSWMAYERYCKREIVHRYAQGCSLSLV